MTLTRKHWMIIAIVIAIIVILYFAMKKKSISESGYAKPGDRWDYRSKHEHSKYNGGNDYGAQFGWMNPITGKSENEM